MIRRTLIFALVIAALVGLIASSQWRPTSNFVSGLIESEEIRLGSRVGGRVLDVMVREGDEVTQGTPLVRFEPYDLHEREQQAIAFLAERTAALNQLTAGQREEEIAQAKSRFDQAAAQLSLIRSGPRSEEIAAAESRVSQSKAALQLAKREYDRVAGLNQRDAVSQSEFDTADERWRAAGSQLRVRENELKILTDGAREQEIQIAAARVEELRSAWELAKKGFRKEEIEQAQAARDAAAASLDAIGVQKKELTLVAPTNGTIDSLDLQPGDLVGPNAPVMSMLSSSQLWVRAYVPQRFLQLKLGQSLDVTIDSYPDEIFPGSVTFISHQAEFTPSNVQTPDDRARQVYRIRVTLEKSDRLRSGMTANVWLNSTGPAL